MVILPAPSGTTPVLAASTGAGSTTKVASAFRAVSIWVAVVWPLTNEIVMFLPDRKTVGMFELALRFSS